MRKTMYGFQNFCTQLHLISFYQSFGKHPLALIKSSLTCFECVRGSPIHCKNELYQTCFILLSAIPRKQDEVIHRAQLLMQKQERGEANTVISGVWNPDVKEKECRPAHTSQQSQCDSSSGDVSYSMQRRTRISKDQGQRRSLLVFS